MGDAIDRPKHGRDIWADFSSRTRADERTATKAFIDPDHLSAVVGPPLETDRSGAAMASTDAPELRLLVGERAPAIDQRGANGEIPQRVRRTRGRRDRLAAVVTAIAVVSVVGALAAAVIALTSTSPTAAALGTLRETEAVLVDGISALNSKIERAEGQRDDAVSRAAALAPVLAAAVLADGPARAAAERARQDFVTSAAAITYPGAVAPYRRAPFDENSLAEVGAAIDKVQQTRMDLQQPHAALSAAETALADAEGPLAQALAAFTVTLPDAGARVREQNPLAAAPLLDAMSAAAARASAADLMTVEGQRALTELVAAASAVQADQLRVAAEQAAQSEESDSSGTYNGSDYALGGDSSGDAGAGGVVVTPPTDEPAPPAPTEPPVDPTPPQPDLGEENPAPAG